MADERPVRTPWTPGSAAPRPPGENSVEMAVGQRARAPWETSTGSGPAVRPAAKPPERIVSAEVSRVPPPAPTAHRAPNEPRNELRLQGEGGGLAKTVDADSFWSLSPVAPKGGDDRARSGPGPAEPLSGEDDRFDPAVGWTYDSLDSVAAEGAAPDGYWDQLPGGHSKVVTAPPPLPIDDDPLANLPLGGAIEAGRQGPPSQESVQSVPGVEAPRPSAPTSTGGWLMGPGASGAAGVAPARVAPVPSVPPPAPPTPPAPSSFLSPSASNPPVPPPYPAPSHRAVPASGQPSSIPAPTQAPVAAMSTPPVPASPGAPSAAPSASLPPLPTLDGPPPPRPPPPSAAAGPTPSVARLTAAAPPELEAGLNEIRALLGDSKNDDAIARLDRLERQYPGDARLQTWREYAERRIAQAICPAARAERIPVLMRPRATIPAVPGTPAGRIVDAIDGRSTVGRVRQAVADLPAQGFYRTLAQLLTHGAMAWVDGQP